MKEIKKINDLSDLRSIFGLPDPVEPEPNTVKKVKNTTQDTSQFLRIHLLRLKGNKEATVIKGFTMSDEAITDLAKSLKQKCGVGGTAKEKEIILQGNHREKVLKLLQELGFKNIKLAGG
jgi:translation initiation factor 1